MQTKIIAAYLPQYHETPENNLFWGNGFTDWIAVKNAQPFKKWHYQPKIPLNHFYYDLSKCSHIKWQVELAKNYGVYGFNIYHYWFNSKTHYLGLPSEILLTDKSLDIHFLFTWDNGSWVRNWKNIKHSNEWITDLTSKKSVLAELKYGNKKDWKIHLDYLLPFFSDDRYIKINGKPVFVFFNQNNEPEIIADMVQYWDEQLKAKGFSGLYSLGVKNREQIQVCSNEYCYEPHFSGLMPRSILGKVKGMLLREAGKPYIMSYDKLWKKILENAEKADSHLFPGAFVSYDDTPRRGKTAKIVAGASPDKFEAYMRRLVQISKRQNKEFIFLTAWNEWGEGAFMEPDEKNKYAYLKALQKALNEKGLDYDSY